MIVGSVVSGVCNRDDWVTRMICGLIHMGSSPAAEVDFNFSSVGYVSQTIAALATLGRECDGVTFNIVNFAGPTPFSSVVRMPLSSFSFWFPYLLDY